MNKKVLHSNVTGGLTNERVRRVVLAGAHPQPEVFNATLDIEKKRKKSTFDITNLATFNHT